MFLDINRAVQTKVISTPSIHQTGQMSNLELEVTPATSVGLHPCVLVMVTLFQQRALVSYRVDYSVEGFGSGPRLSRF